MQGEAKEKMMSNLFIGSLSYKLTDSDLQELFEKFGEVVSAKVITDRDTGRSRGFGFVEMSNEGDADKAIEELNGSDVDGRTIVVKKAHNKERR